MYKTIALKLIGGQWYARLSHDDGKILTLFGEPLAWIPTGYTDKAQPSEVIAGIKASHPEAAVGLAGTGTATQASLI
jgi:hypothetical protein